MDTELKYIYDSFFSYLVAEFGFELVENNFHPESFGNFYLLFSKGNDKIRIVSDKSQVFVEIRKNNIEWILKEKYLENKGVMRTRFETKDGLWTGYEIENQSKDLRKYLNLIFSI